MVCFYEDIKDIFFKALQKHNNPGNPKKKEKPDSDSQIVAFYRFLARDNKGRLLSDIWDFSPLRLQFQHDFIQWLFPTQEPSAHNKHAPILTKQDIAAIRADRNIQTNMLISFQLMLEFYGFTVNISDNPAIVVSEDFYRCSKRWLKKRNHNFLRITRIIKSLRCFGLDRYAMAFQDVLEEIAEETDVISDETLSHWLDA